MPFGAEEAAPGWVPIVAFAIPVAIMLLVGIPALRLRARAKAARQAQAGRRPEQGVDLGSVATIDDPSAFTTGAVLKALAVRPEDYGPTDDMPYDEGWAGTMLGLKSKISSSTSLLEPHVFWGTYAGHQVFIRLGPDEKVAGGTSLMSNKHVRQITVVRVLAPDFQIDSHDGALVATGASPFEIQGLIGSLSADVATWSDTRVTGGADGIVAARAAVDGIENSWVYDLWLCERIAAALRLAPLKAARVGPAWKVPYGLGRSLTPDRTAGRSP
jgi:hypothetical protein